MRVCDIIVLFCISLIGLSGCVSKPYPEALRQAERCMEANPDSARLYLATLDSGISAEPEETRMYYYLLKTKANDKLYVKHTSDSLMLQVMRFYEQRGDADKLMEAYYYLGSVYRDMNDAPRALKAFQQAAEAGKESSNYRVLGRLYEQIGTLFAYQELYTESRQSVNKALKYHQLCDYAEGIVYNYRNTARIYDRTNQPDSAEYFYRKSCQAAQRLNNSFIEEHIVCEWISYYIAHNEIEKAEDLIPSLSSRMQQDDAITLHALGGNSPASSADRFRSVLFPTGFAKRKSVCALRYLSSLGRSGGRMWELPVGFRVCPEQPVVERFHPENHPDGGCG